MVIGNKKEYVTAILNMDFENTGRWAERNHVPYTSHPDLSQKAAVRKLLAGFIQKVNTAIPEKTRVKKFIVLHKDFDHLIALMNKR
jgi:long-chain acyl-CoA synthetase